MWVPLIFMTPIGSGLSPATVSSIPSPAFISAIHLIKRSKINHHFRHLKKLKIPKIILPQTQWFPFPTQFDIPLNQPLTTTWHRWSRQAAVCPSRVPSLPSPLRRCCLSPFFVYYHSSMPTTTCLLRSRFTPPRWFPLPHWSSLHLDSEFHFCVFFCNKSRSLLKSLLSKPPS